jgi:hypothetical protein
MMGDSSQLSFEGATTEQEDILREITDWPAVPDFGRNIQIVVGNHGNHGGATGIMLSNFVPQIDHIGYTYLHEYGHTWDYHWLTAADRQAIIDLYDMPFNWRMDGPYMTQPVERFAGTFGEMMMRSEGYIVNSAFESVEPPFTDIGDLSQEMQDAILKMYHKDITKGTSITTYSPNDPVTRGQMAVFFDRAGLLD